MSPPRVRVGQLCLPEGRVVQRTLPGARLDGAGRRVAHACGGLHRGRRGGGGAAERQSGGGAAGSARTAASRRRQDLALACRRADQAAPRGQGAPRPRPRPRPCPTHHTALALAATLAPLSSEPPLAKQRHFPDTSPATSPRTHTALLATPSPTPRRGASRRSWTRCSPRGPPRRAARRSGGRRRRRRAAGRREAAASLRRR